jgi:hypothetical protein
MRIFAAWMSTAVLALVACGGDVILDGTGSTGAAGAGGGGFGGTGTCGFGNGGTAGSGSGGGGGAGGNAPNCPPTCDQALNGGGEPCVSDGTARADYVQLRLCAGCSDVGNCEGVCVNLCEALATDADCLMCLQSSCPSQLFACQSN